MTTQTIYEVAAEFRCSPYKIAKTARENDIGMNLGGRAGWRFDQADKDALKAAFKPVQQPPVARRRRRRNVA